MRTIQKIIFLLLLGLFFTHANAYTSYGVRGCGTLISAIDTTSEKDKYNKDLTEMTVRSWIAGYITANNAWLDAFTKKNDSNSIAQTNLDGVWMSVLNYCRANPLKDTDDAVVDVLNQLAPPPTKGKR
jgi:hypothetical protein